ncbi:MAG: hypothetical protein KJ000_11870 [Pirellulaceae bacterium]|nr:hypothetical protein [Pirellulaceae bacterium]
MPRTAEAFVQAGRSALSFLEVKHGFVLVETILPPEAGASPPFYQLTYRKMASPAENLFVCLSTAPHRLELDFEFGCGWPPEYVNTIHVCELLEIESPGSPVMFAADIYGRFGDVERMTAQYCEMANVLDRFGHRFFANDRSLWEAVWQLRQLRIQQESDQETARLAESAFKRHEWRKAIEMLESLGDKRTKLQNAQLQYARKQDERSA